MSSIRVVPTPAHSRLDRNQALSIICTWVTRYTQRCSLRPGEPTSPDILIERSIAKRIIAREQIFERHLPISWPRFVAGLISLVLVFSDVFRSGLSVSSLQKLYPVLQPDEVVNFGTSWNHSVFKSSKDEALACNSSARVWSYKFDSTSISWRAFARYFDLAEFPACILYKESCPSTRICGDVAFKMIDSLVNEVARVKNNDKNVKTPSLGPVTLTLRTQNAYIDRFHQLLLPRWFANVNWRTSQALYYSPEVLAATNTRDICFPTNRRGRSRIPRFCQQLWINFQRSCASSDSEGQAVGLLYGHTLRRVQDIQVKYPSLTVDLTLLESQDDLQVNRGGLSSLGFRWSDVSTIIRARNCSDKGCETVYVDDYRYETGLMVSDIVQWYRVVAALRIIGQSYFFLRGIGLLLSCYFIHNKKTTIWINLQKACQLFTKVPTQCVVYGSPFPVACYVLAHLLDAPFTYQVLESHYLSKDGIININLEAFISYTVVQMRNVWIYSLTWHIVVKMSTTRWMGQTHQPNNGIIGIPEFLLSGFSSITLSAQYRSTSFRSTKILEVIVLPDNVGRAWELVKYRYSFGYRGRGNAFLGGVFIDIKFLHCLLFTVVVLRAVRTVWINYRVLTYGEDKYKYSQWFLLSPTPVPYSAGVLWPTVSMCVHWTSDFFCIQERNQPTRTQTQSKLWNRWRCLRWRRPVLPLPMISNRLLSDKLLRQYKDNTPSVRMNVNTFRYIQHQMKCLHGRSSNVEANVAFMNAVLMSDPLVYFQMVYNSTELAYYQSVLRPTQILLLPVEVVNNYNEYSRGLQLLKRVNTAQLSWAELVQCG